MKTILKPEVKQRVQDYRTAVSNEADAVEKGDTKRAKLQTLADTLETEIGQGEPKIDVTDEAACRSLADKKERLAMVRKQLDASNGGDETKLRELLMQAPDIMIEAAQPGIAAIVELGKKAFSGFYFQPGFAEQAAKSTQLYSFVVNDIKRPRVNFGKDYGSVLGDARQLLVQLDAFLAGRFPTVLPPQIEAQFAK